MNTTFDRLCAILVSDHKLPLERLTLDARLDELGLDSLATVELLWSVEDDFQITLPREPADLPTLEHVVRYIEERMAAKHLPSPPAAGAAPNLRVS